MSSHSEHCQGNRQVPELTSQVPEPTHPTRAGRVDQPQPDRPRPFLDRAPMIGRESGAAYVHSVEAVMALSSLTELDKFKAAPFVAGYPDAARTFYSPVDQVHDALKALVSSATKSLVVSMYGYDDDELDQAIRDKLGSDKIFVQLSLDKSQSAGAHEKAILAKWQNDGIGNSIAIGKSEHGAIMHMKMVI